MRFEWDVAKARENLRKHGISFPAAESAFDDEWAMMRPDPDHSLAEDRFILLGIDAHLRLLTVAFSFHAGSDWVRIISARRSTPSERAQYGSQ